MPNPVTIFVDRDGDELQVVARNQHGNASTDPVLTVQKKGPYGGIRQSVVFIEDEFPEIVIKLVKELHLNKDQVTKTIFGLSDYFDTLTEEKNVQD